MGVVSAFFFVDDATLVGLITSQIESASDTQIHYDKNASITRTLFPTLSVNDLTIQSQKGFKVNSRHLEVQISLPRLIVGEIDLPRIQIEDVRMEMTADLGSGKSITVSPPKRVPILPRPLKFVLHDLDISGLTLVREHQEMHWPNLDVDELTGVFVPESDQVIISSEIQLLEKTFQVDATLNDIGNVLTGQSLFLTLIVQNTLGKITADGHIDFRDFQPELAFTVHGNVTDLEGVKTGIKGFRMPGEISLDAQLSGAAHQLRVPELSVTWKGPDNSSMTMNGRIGNVAGLDEIALVLKGDLKKPNWIPPILPKNIGALRHIALGASVSGACDNLNIREFSLATETVDKLKVMLTGQFDVLTALNNPVPENIKAKLMFSAPTTRAARALLYERVPEFGPISGSADIQSTSGTPAFNNITVLAQDQRKVRASLHGRIASLPLNRQQSITGYDLNVAMNAAESSVMGERLGMTLKLSGPLRSSFKIKGDTQAMRFESIRLSAGRKNAVQIHAAGHIHCGAWRRKDPIQNMDIKVNATSYDTEAIGTLVGKSLPELGPLRMQARLVNVSGKRRVKDLVIRTTSEAPIDLSMTGAANHFAFSPEISFLGGKFQVAVSVDDTATLNNVFGFNNRIPAIGSGNATSQISGTNREIVVDQITASAGQQDILLVEVNGGHCRLKASNGWRPQETNIWVEARSGHIGLLSEALGFRLPLPWPLTASGVIEDKEKNAGALRRLYSGWKSP